MKYLLILLISLVALPCLAQQKDFDFSFTVGKCTVIGTVIKDTVSRTTTIKIEKQGRSLKVIEGNIVTDSWHVLYQGVSKQGFLIYVAGSRTIAMVPGVYLEVQDPLAGKVEIYQ